MTTLETIMVSRHQSYKPIRNLYINQVVSNYLVKIVPRGEKNKLSDSDIQEILKLKGAKSAYIIAKEFGVSHTMIYKIWKSPEKYQNQVKDSLGLRIDAEILKKLIPAFIKADIEVDLNPDEVMRIQQLAKEVL